MSEIATGKLVIWMRLQAKRITPDGNSTSIMLSAAASRLEQQEQRIAELEAENREIRQNSISHATHAEFISDYQEQLDEKDAKIAELNDFQNSQCAKLLVRNGELERELEWKDKVIELAQRKQDEAERELAAAKGEFEVIRQDGLCEVCIFGDSAPSDCSEDCCFVWRGLQEAEKGESHETNL